MNKINKFYKFTLVLVGIVMLLILFSCSSQEKRDKKVLTKERFNSELAKISFSLAMINAETSTKAEFYCKFSSIEPDQAEDEYMRQVLNEMKTRNDAFCVVFKKAEAYTSKVADIALKTKKVPSDGFLFFAISETSSEERDDIYEEQTIGLFETLEECKAAEKILRDCDIGTRKCRSWKSSKVYKLDDLYFNEKKEEKK